MVDAVVAGAGPAGSSLALRLARAGARVTLVERARFPRRKVCGEYLNAGAVRLLRELGVAAALEKYAAPLRGLRLVTTGAPLVELPFVEEALALARERLDAILLEAALAAGVTLVNGRVEGLRSENGRARAVVVRDEAGNTVDIGARFIVGADGAGSVVARKAGLTVASPGARRFAIGGHYERCGDLDGRVEMYVGGGAYFALNPLDAQKANVMVVVREEQLAAWSGGVDEGVRGKAAELGRQHRSFAAASRIGARVSVGPLAHATSRAVAPGVVLVGDAAGFLNPFTGQGVFLALRTARSAAEAIVQALAAPSREAEFFARYDRERARDFAARKMLGAAVGLLIDVPALARRAAHRLERRPGVARALVASLAGLRAPQYALRPAVLGQLLL